MQAKLLSENEKSVIVEMGGKKIPIAKTPGNEKLISTLKNSGEKQGKDIFAGKKVPGEPKVPGKNTPENDTVTADVSGGGKIKVAPGEGIIPLEAMRSEESAIAFVKKMFSKPMNQGGEVEDYYDGGEVDPAKQAAESMRKAFKFGKKFADGGIVEGYEDEEEDEDDGDTTVSQAVPMANKGGRVTKDGVACYQDGGFVGGAPPPINDEEEDTAAPFMGGAPQPVDTISTGTGFGGSGATGTWTPTANPNDAVVTGASAEAGANPPAPATPAATGSPSVVDLHSSRNQQSGVQGPYAKEVKDTTQALLNAKKAEADVIAAGNQEQAATMFLNAQRAQAQVEENARVAAREKLELDRQLSKSDEVRKKYLNMKVDPKNLWSSEGTGNRVLAGIGLLLGGFGQAFNGKDNPAINIINTALERDLEVQKAQIDKARGDVEMQDSLFGQMRDVYKDNRAAELATLATMKERTAMQLEMQAKQSASNQAKAAGESAAAQIKQSAAMDMAKANTYLNVQESTQKPTKTNPLAGDDLKTYQASVSLINKLSAMRELKKSVDTGIVDARVARILGTLGYEGSMDAAALRANATDIMAKYGKQQFGAMSESEKALAGDVAPKLEDSDSVFLSKLNSMDTNIRRDLKSNIQIWRDLKYDVKDPERYLIGDKGERFDFRGRTKSKSR